jgi:valyl-tRNA synthetase
MVNKQLPKNFEFAKAEKQWYQYWEQKGFFKPRDKTDAKNYCIVIPPPNVTGVLHIGHALNNTLQDILIRYHRMLGENTLWQPGTDHAGIATQYVVEKELQKEGTSRRQLGREKFIARVWKWKEEKGGAIIEQLKRLGASCDWSRTRFTMDEGLSAAVREVFVRLYEEGLIYRGKYLVNWCTSCGTALSQLEAELGESDEQGQLWYIRYPLVQGQGYVTVATTRPETLLGDTAVAVNPEDDRYQKLIGKMVRLPCTDRTIPVIADAYVDKEFGTGALKITPAHDFNDYEIGLRHKLDLVQVIDTEGKMTGPVGKYRGMDRFDCRKLIVEDLQAQGLLEKISPYPVRPARCYRCKTVVEPTLSEQWFVKVRPLAEPAIDAVKTGRSRIIPESEAKKYFNWMENLRDWCISRQLWWGHRIPAWYCRECKAITVSRKDPQKCSKCGSTQIDQDPDVLDTWFSSQLWPFSTLGWPEPTPELKRFYPNSVLVTGFDILFFWVARMMMAGIHFMKDVPFHDIFLHGLVRDEHGEKFSKTKGNVIDPLEIIDEFGADALRLALVLLAFLGRDLRLSKKRIEDSKHFINKIWNASRFALSQLEDFDPGQRPAGEKSLADRWVLSRLQAAIRETRRLIDSYQFSEAAQAVYHFFWDEFCDWYIEWSKPFFYRPEKPAQKIAAQNTIRHVLDQALRLLHPFMPFLTEEIWQALPGHGESIMTAKFPEPDPELSDPNAEAAAADLQEAVSALRVLRAENMVPIAAKVKVLILADDQATAEFFQEHKLYIESPPQVNIRELEIKTGADKPMSFVAHRIKKAEVCLDLAGLVDFDREEARLKKEIDKIDRELSRIDSTLAKPGFADKAPKEVIEKQLAIKNELLEKQQAVLANIKRLQALRARVK